MFYRVPNVVLTFAEKFENYRIAPYLQSHYMFLATIYIAFFFKFTVTSFFLII